MRNYKVIDVDAFEADLASVADTIRAKNGSDELYEFPTGYQSAIASLSSVKEKDVNFYDIDGTLLYSYTLDEAQALTELPPSGGYHEGLVFDGWNWELDAVKALTYPMDIGALYNTIDGACWLFLDLTVNEQLTQELHFSQTVENVVEIDWGDGSEKETIGGTGLVAMSHTYSALGEYIVKIYASTYKCTLGANSSTTNIFGNINNYHNRNILKKLYASNGYFVSQYCFSYCYDLEIANIRFSAANASITTRCFTDCYNLRCAILANSLYPTQPHAFYRCYNLRTACIGNKSKNTQGSSFYQCYSLKRRMLPETCTMGQGYDVFDCKSLQESSGTASASALHNCRDCNSLRRFYLANGSTGIATSFFENCYSLSEIDIPATVTTIDANAFAKCYSLLRIRFNSTTPPTIANVNAFTGVPTACVVEVPAGTLEAYQSAENYSVIASQMVEV